jgi:pSer/pThr/pTyr-binding forkhead associated (FHA) protein
MATDTFAGWIIGTAEDCDMTVVDEYASARHARIFRDVLTKRVYVEDLGSMNGTYVQLSSGHRGKVGPPFEIHPGDIVIVGRTRIPWTEKP